MINNAEEFMVAIGELDTLLAAPGGRRSSAQRRRLVTLARAATRYLLDDSRHGEPLSQPQRAKAELLWSKVETLYTAQERRAH